MNEHDKPDTEVETLVLRLADSIERDRGLEPNEKAILTASLGLISALVSATVRQADAAERSASAIERMADVVDVVAAALDGVLGTGDAEATEERHGWCGDEPPPAPDAPGYVEAISGYPARTVQVSPSAVGWTPWPEEGERVWRTACGGIFTFPPGVPQELTRYESAHPGEPAGYGAPGRAVLREPVIRLPEIAWGLDE